MYDHLTDKDLGDGLTEAELYFWATEKRKENLEHRATGHNDFCRHCDNCLAGDSRWRCMCGAGKRMVSPYRIRFLREKDRTSS